MVQEGRRNATSNVRDVGEAVVRQISFVCRTRADRALTSTRLHCTGGGASDRTCGVNDLAGSCDATPPPAAAVLEYRASTAQWHAERSARRTKADKACAERDLAGLCPGPAGGAGRSSEWRFCSWPVRSLERATTRTAAVSPMGACLESRRQIARRLPVDFPDDITMRISHEAIYQALFVQGRGALRRELTACLRTGRVLRMPRARTRRRGQKLCIIRDHDQPTPSRSRRPCSAGALGKAISFWGLGQLRYRNTCRAHDAVHHAAAPAANDRSR